MSMNELQYSRLQLGVKINTIHNTSARDASVDEAKGQELDSS